MYARCLWRIATGTCGLVWSCFVRVFVPRRCLVELVEQRERGVFRRSRRLRSQRTVFVVMESGWELDDEVLNPIGRRAVRAFQQRERADAWCRRLNHMALRGLEIQRYAYDLRDFFPSVQDLPAFLGSVGLREDSQVIPRTLPDEALDRIVAASGLDFYAVVEVPTE